MNKNSDILERATFSPKINLQIKLLTFVLLFSLFQVNATSTNSPEKITTLMELNDVISKNEIIQKQVTGVVTDKAGLPLPNVNVIEKGKRNVEILKQGLNDPYTVEDQVAIIYAGSKNLLRSVPVDQVKAFEKAYLEELNAKHRDTLDTIKSGKLTDEVLDTLNAVAKSISAQFE